MGFIVSCLCLCRERATEPLKNFVISTAAEGAGRGGERGRGRGREQGEGEWGRRRGEGE